MRTFLWLWVAPIGFLALWYGLSANDAGAIFFSREVHDRTFDIYSAMLGIPKEKLVPLLGKAVVVDSALILAILAFRRRSKIRTWWVERRSGEASHASVGYRPRTESLSNAP